MGSIIKFIFYTYVILLAGYVTYKSIITRSFGHHDLKYEQADQKCFKGGPDWKFCTHTINGTNPKALLYYFHGKGGNENSWNEGRGFTGLLRQHWTDNRGTTPLVVSVSFGKTWLITKKMSKQPSGLLERFKAEVLPVIEKKLGTPKARFVVGNSMGALNALSLSLESPKLFSRVAALCPPMADLSPYANWKKIVGFITRTGAEPKSVVTLIAMGRSYFSSTAEWLNYSPLEKVGQTSFDPHRHFYMVAGTDDRYGLFEGVEMFVEKLKKAGAQVHWHPNTGGHCTVDTVSLATFLKI